MVFTPRANCWREAFSRTGFSLSGFDFLPTQTEDRLKPVPHASLTRALPFVIIPWACAPARLSAGGIYQSARNDSGVRQFGQLHLARNGHDPAAGRRRARQKRNAAAPG